MTNENRSLKQKYESAKLKLDNLKEKNEFLEPECAKLQIENIDLLLDNYIHTINLVILMPVFNPMK